MCNLSTSSAITVSHERANSWSRRLADYVELTKPRIMVMVLVTVAISGVVATWGEPDVVRLLNAVIATGFVAASASVMNQWLERGTDAMMPRTANRPLPAGRLGSTEVFCFGLVTAIAGLGYLWLACGLLAMFFAEAVHNWLTNYDAEIFFWIEFFDAIYKYILYGMLSKEPLVVFKNPMHIY